MSKDQDEFKNTLCECLHIRDYHSDIDGHCYVLSCWCNKFVKLEVVRR